METAIKIGNEISDKSAANVRKTIESILRIGFQTHADQETIREALHCMTAAFKVENVTLTGCNINGDKVINT
jgi:hypothetical protein